MDKIKDGDEDIMNEEDEIKESFNNFNKFRSKQSLKILVRLIPQLVEVRRLLILLVNSQGRADDPGELLDDNLLDDINEKINTARKELDKKLN